MKKFLMALIVMSSSVFQSILCETFSLKAILDYTLTHNKKIQAAGHRFNAADSKLISNWALPKPEISFNYSYIPTNKGINNFGERSIQITQNFDFPLKQMYKSDLNYIEKDLSGNIMQRTISETITDVKLKYFTFLLKTKEVFLAEENFKISSEINEKAEVNLKIGEKSNIEALTSRVAKAQAKNSLAIAKKEKSAALNKLLFAMNFDDNKPISIEDSLTFSKIKISFDELIAKTLKENPDYKEANLAFQSSKISKKLAWSELLPEFNISYASQLQDGNSKLYGVGFGMSVPLWFMFENRSKIEEASAISLASEAELNYTKQKIASELRNSFNNLESQISEIKIHETELLPQAQEALKAAEVSFFAGEISYTEFLQAKQIYIGTKQNYYNSIFEYYSNLIELESISGTQIF